MTIKFGKFKLIIEKKTRIVQKPYCLFCGSFNLKILEGYREGIYIQCKKCKEIKLYMPVRNVS